MEKNIFSRRVKERQTFSDFSHHAQFYIIMVKSGRINSLENLTKFQNETFFLTQA